jgi:hypothetical protein
MRGSKHRRGCDSDSSPNVLVTYAIVGVAHEYRGWWRLAGILQRSVESQQSTRHKGAHGVGELVESKAHVGDAAAQDSFVDKGLENGGVIHQLKHIRNRNAALS